MEFTGCNDFENGSDSESVFSDYKNEDFENKDNEDTEQKKLDEDPNIEGSTKRDEEDLENNEDEEDIEYLEKKWDEEDLKKKRDEEDLKKIQDEEDLKNNEDEEDIEYREKKWDEEDLKKMRDEEDLKKIQDVEDPKKMLDAGREEEYEAITSNLKIPTVEEMQSKITDCEAKKKPYFISSDGDVFSFVIGTEYGRFLSSLRYYDRKTETVLEMGMVIPGYGMFIAALINRDADRASFLFFKDDKFHHTNEASSVFALPTHKYHIVQMFYFESWIS